MGEHLTGPVLRRIKSLPWRAVIDVTAGLVMIAAATLVIRAYWPSTPTAKDSPTVASLPEGIAPVPDDWMHGRADAPLVLIVYSDFECPVCGTFARDLWPDLIRTYGADGQVAFVFRHLANEARHKHALKAAQAAECGGKQGRFWQMHDRIFVDQQRLAESDLRQHAVGIGLDLKLFDTCFAGTMTDKVRRHTKEGLGFGVSGSPTFFIGKRSSNGKIRVIGRVNGIRPLPDFRRLLDEFIARPLIGSRP